MTRSFLLCLESKKVLVCLLKSWNLKTHAFWHVVALPPFRKLKGLCVSVIRSFSDFLNRSYQENAIDKKHSPSMLRAHSFKCSRIGVTN